MITIQMDLDTQTINRSVYNTLNLLGDIGGFYGLFAAFGTFILGILNYNKSDNYLAQDLFLFENKKEKVELM